MLTLSCCCSLAPQIPARRGRHRSRGRRRPPLGPTSPFKPMPVRRPTPSGTASTGPPVSPSESVNPFSTTASKCRTLDSDHNLLTHSVCCTDRCSDGYMGQRCEFKDLDGSYLRKCFCGPQSVRNDPNRHSGHFVPSSSIPGKDSGGDGWHRRRRHPCGDGSDGAADLFLHLSEVSTMTMTTVTQQ